VSPELFPAFLVAAWLVSLSPGAGAAYAMSCGMAHGAARGLWGVAGLQAGVATLLAVVVAGIGALVAASPAAFETIRWAGVGYLAWLGWRQLRSGGEPGRDQHEARAFGRRRLLLRGWAVNAANPKGLVFMLAVMPQFVDPTRALAPQYAAICATLLAVDATVMAAYAVLAARVARRLRGVRERRLLDRGFGIAFLVAGMLLAGFHR
jgi:homoserine/homoserine lactone efflux protein